MEKTYKVLKIVALVLAIAVIAVGIWRIAAPAPTQTPTEVSVPVESTEPVELAPDFTVYDIDGNPVCLSELRGRPVILNFWASWCGPCKSEMPDIEQAYLEYGDQVQFLIIDLTEGRTETVQLASEYIAQQGYTFPVYYDVDQSAVVAYSITAIPMTCFIDSNGALTGSHVGVISPEELTSNILSLLETA